MADYFTREHFKLLDQWKGQNRDESNPEQNRAYEALKDAYALMQAWAIDVQAKMFPEGRVVARGPGQQGPVLPRYIVAYIYPYACAPAELAYSLSIDAGEAFVVRLGTRGLDREHSTRKAFLQLVSAQTGAEVNAAKLSATEGLAKNLEQLVSWSAESIRRFKLRYDDVVTKLNLNATLSDESLFERFDRKLAFQASRTSWSPQDKTLFCQLARTLHAAGLDCWHVGSRNTNTVRFGRVDAERGHVVSVLGSMRGARAPALSWLKPVGAMTTFQRQPLTQERVAQIEAALAAERAKPDGWWVLKLERSGLWPDQLRDNWLDPDEASDEDDLSDLAADPEIEAEIEAEAEAEFAKQCINRIYYGPPGTGKTYELSKLLEREYEQGTAGGRDADALQRYSFVTFHQSYGYEEFVEGLRPVLDCDVQAGEIQYEIRSGVFKDLCRRAREAPNQRFAMVIDEINRGNISKIFGELITLIEPDKREGTENAVSVTLAYSGERFAVPANVDIIGTMNTADRSLALLDTALRRRFEFVPVMPDARDEPGAPLAGLRVSARGQVINVPRLLDALNQRVEALYDRDHCIGHAYFTPLARVPDGDERLSALHRVFSTRILPLLEEYFFEDWQKIRLVLADNQKPAAAQFVLESRDHGDDLARLFGSNHGLDSYATKRRYALQDAALWNPGAYIGIYQTLSA